MVKNWIGLGALAIISMTMSHGWAQQLREIKTPAGGAARPVTNSVVLTGEDHSVVMRRLRVLRQYNIGELRAKPSVALGAGRANFAPLLDSPASTFNMAQRLRALPRHIEVRAEETTVAEIEQGLMVHSYLSYRILPGACRNADSRAQLAAAGVSCFTAQPPGARIAAFANPRSPRYIADPARRARAVAEYQEKLRISQAANAKHITDLRRVLADPQQRGAVAARLGAAEAERLRSLNDEQLKDEIINSSVNEIEQDMYVPKADSLASFPRIAAMRIVPGSVLRPPSSRASPPVQAKAEFHREQKLGPYIYLTGFTLGRDYEWGMKFQTTINWCVVFDCPETYYIRPYAGFSYGFGLRFPISTTLTYTYDWRANDRADARVMVDYAPIDGSPADYISAGLGQDQLFDGKELVAQVEAHAGIDLRVPIFGTQGIGPLTVGKDFTEGLPHPYTRGQFRPPAPGDQQLNGDFFRYDADFLGAAANFVVVGAQVVPAVRVGLTSDRLGFTLVDNVSQKPTPVVQPGLSYHVDVKDNLASFSLKDPLYRLTFHLTPGIDVHVFVDVEVWSHDWNLPIWFPEMEITLPRGGATFSCHDGTTCSRDFSEPALPTEGEKFIKDLRKLPPNLVR